MVSRSPKVCFTATIPYINPNFRYWLGERYTNHTSILLPLNTISPPQNVFYKDHHKHKISLFFYSLITSLGLTDDSVHYFSSSPFKTCFHSKTKTALHFNGCKIPSPSWISYKSPPVHIVESISEIFQQQCCTRPTTITDFSQLRKLSLSLS